MHRPLVDRRPTDYGHQDPCVVELGRWDPGQIAVQEDEVGQLAGDKRSFLTPLKLGIMLVRIDETRDEHRAVGIHHASGGGDQFLHLGARPDRGQTVAPHCHGTRPGPARFARPYLCIDDCEGNRP